jgi:hypothetical protein
MTPEINKNKSSLAPSELAELKDLIGASSDRPLLPGESERLELILAASREARSIFTAYMQLDAGLDWKIRGSQSVAEVLERSRQTASCSMEPGRLTQAVRPVLMRMRSFSLLALAASLAFVVPSIAWFSLHSSRDTTGGVATADPKTSNESAMPLPAADQQAVANIVQLSKECRWFVENRRSADGAVHAGDKVRLTRGQLRMDFACGATVTMRSPAALEVISPMRTRMVLGTLKAHVATGGEGFTVETPRTTVVDLGTDFGIDVSRHGSTDVIVFKGAVDLHSDGVHGIKSRQRLIAGEGVRVSGEGTASRIVSILDSQFSMAESRRGRDRTPVISEVRDNIRRGESWNYYEIVHGGMREDAKAFVDREHEWNGVYALGMPRYLLGADYVKTFNDDKFNREVEIRVTIARPAVLYVLLDKRSPVPDWLRSRFFNTGDEIGLDGSKYTRFGDRKSLGVGAGTSIDDVFSVWRLDVPAADTITLGAIQAGGETHNMYGIVAVPMEIHASRDDFPGSASHPTQKWAELTTALNGELSADGEIERPKDADVFRFDWKGGVAEVACQTSGFTTLDPVLSVYDAHETLVGYARAARVGRERTAIKMNLPAGAYYVAVTGSDELGEVGSYHLQVASASADIVPPLRASPSLVLTGSPSKTGVELSWSHVPKVKSYIVEKSADAVTFDRFATTETTRLDDTIDPGHLCIYRVRAETTDSPASAPLLISAPAPAVTRLQAFGNSPRSVILEWRDVIREQGYRIERSINGGPFATIGTAPQNACGFRDTDITPGARYAYRVATVSSPTQEAISESVSALSGVADLSAVALGNDGVALSWKAGHPNARYFIERAVGGPDSFVTIGAVNGDTQKFVDRTAVAGEQPRYRVVTVEDASELNEVKTETIDRVRLPGWVGDEHFFALRFTGKIKIAERGKYNFYLTSDDGSRLFLDGALVVNNDERHVEQTVCGTIEVEAGTHELEVQYFQHDGSKKLELSWAGRVPYAEVSPDILSSLTVQYYKGTWWRLPFTRSCAVSDVVNVKKPVIAIGSRK